MWWEGGFPNHTPTAPWLRVIETGSYAIALNTETLQIPRFGSGDAPADLELKITVGDKVYRATGGGKWTRFTGPRLIESGRCFQRADVTDLVFQSEDGETLNTEARFETAAWPDRLGLILAAGPGLQPIRSGEASFGMIDGGYGFDGTNDLVIPHAQELEPEQFTLELWAFVPTDYQASPRVSPWLVCKNRNEAANGNFGLMIVNGKAVARMNIDGAFQVESKPLKLETWSKLAMSYDGNILRLFVNDRVEGEQKIGRPRKPGIHALAFGRREDNHGDGYHFRGIIDEVKLLDRDRKLIREWGFRAEGQGSPGKIREPWNEATLEIGLKTEKGTLRQSSSGNEVFLAIDPVAFKEEAESPIVVSASDRPVVFDPARGWHRINLDGIEPEGDANDAIERIKFRLANPTGEEKIARLMFEKTAHGIRQSIGSPITGITAVLRDVEGNPTGIPVQLSKNWHNDPEGGVYSGQWFHGISQIRLPAGCRTDVELVLAYGHWGGVPAASHAQLCLIGWGGNTLWDQSALGAWGESICYDPDQAQANCTITDVRPLMVTPMGDRKRWSWTTNMGGGDIFRFFDPAGTRIAHTGMRTTYHKQGPCLTEVTYAGKIGEGIRHSASVSLGRTDDIVRGTYRIRLEVEKAVAFSRFVIFQIGADTYNATSEGKMAFGNESGLTKEWETNGGGNTYRTKPLQLVGSVPWVSLHEGIARETDKGGAIANRGLVVREWKARLGGKEAAPWIAERGLTLHQTDSSTLDILPPPGVTRLEAGDYVDATIEHLIVPQFAKDYYGSNEALRSSLGKYENTWRMIHREAAGNDRHVEMKVGDLLSRYPALAIRTVEDRAEFTLSGGLGYVPVTFTGLTSPRGYELSVDGEPVDQSVHGSDFWQTDFDPETKRWSRTYNVPCGGQEFSLRRRGL
jgi:hypothetical protein